MFISIDLDAFYCGVEEHIAPRLRGEAFCVVQKHCVATLSYPARALGLKKLDNVDNVKRKFPHLEMINGEDLSKYRQAGNQIYQWVSQILGRLPVERLGIEEMRLDISSIVESTAAKLPPLRKLQALITDPDFMDEVGAAGLQFPLENAPLFPEFYFQFEGRTWPDGHEKLENVSSLCAYIAGHLAAYIRDRMWLELGYSCSIGVATSKNIAKMVGNKHKPRGVTVLEPGFERELLVTTLAQSVPGLGVTCRNALEVERTTSVGEILAKYSEEEFIDRTSPHIGETAAKSLWELLNGNDVDGLEIKPFSMPMQISIEESYAGVCLPHRWRDELSKICRSLLAQVRIDWYDEEIREWRRVPLTCRVSLIFAKQGYFRKSKSAKYTWAICDMPETVGDKLIDTSLNLMRELVDTHQGQPRVINVAFVS